MGFWWPFLAAQADGPDSRIGIILCFSGPFVLWAGIAAVPAGRRLLVTAKPEKLHPALCALGFPLAIGAVLPMAWLLLVFTYGLFAFPHR